MLKDRLKEHKRDITTNKKTSVLAKHCFSHKHTINFDDFEILDVESDWRRRITSETFFIHTQNTPLNRKEDSDGLRCQYTCIVDAYKNLV